MASWSRTSPVAADRFDNCRSSHCWKRRPNGKCHRDALARMVGLPPASGRRGWLCRLRRRPLRHDCLRRLHPLGPKDLERGTAFATDATEIERLTAARSPRSRQGRPTLGVSSLNLGRSPKGGRPFLLWHSIPQIGGIVRAGSKHYPSRKSVFFVSNSLR